MSIATTNPAGGSAARVETSPGGTSTGTRLSAGPGVGGAGGGGGKLGKVYFGLSVAMWLQLGMLALVFAALFWPNLRRLWLKTNPIWGEPNWGHAICVPIIGIYYLYVNRDELMKAGIKPLLIGGFTRNRFISAGLMVLVGLACAFVLPALGGVLARQEGNLFAVGMALSVWGVLAAAFNWGVGSLIFGILFYVYGIHPGKNDYVKDLGMVVTLFGAVLTLFGWGVMRIAWFPIAFLICALPWPGLVYSWVASPLQELAAWVAVIVLKVSGVDAYYWGTKIFVGSAGRTLNVAEACAGMRSLMTFITVGAAVAFLSSRPLWQKLFITAMSVPIAVFCNVMRVSGQGLLDTYVSYQLSESFAHQFVGIIMLIPAFFLIMLMGWLLDQLFVEEVDEAQLAAEGGKGTAMLQASQPAKPAVAAAVPVAAVPAAVASAAAGIPAAAMSGVARSAAVPPPAARSAERSGGTGVPPMVGGGQTGGGQVGGVRRIVPPGAVSRPEDKTTGPEAT